MKTFVLLAVSIALVGILFCPMVIAAPSMPSDLQMVQPDPSLPKELSASWGKWEGSGSGGKVNWFLIVEKINEEKASLYVWREMSHPENAGDRGWNRYEASVTKQGGKYRLLFRDGFGPYRLTIKGQSLDVDGGGGTLLKRVP